MVKSAAIVLGTLLMMFVGWVNFSAGRTIGVTPSAEAQVLADKTRVTVTIPGPDAEYRITQGLIQRDLGERLGIGGPEALELAPYALEDTSAPANRESAQWVEASNCNDLRWIGSAAVRSGVPTILDFPIRQLVSGDAVFSFEYERKIGVSGQISYFRAPVAIVEQCTADSAVDQLSAKDVGSTHSRFRA